jgi:8-oxo-dGTP pyrophosphatase MutT (NUDIX family)
MQETRTKNTKRTTSIGFAVRCKDGRYLLGRADGHSPPYCWTLFKGGVEGEESPIETAMRELKEETGIDVSADHRLNRNISTSHIYSYSMKTKDVFIYLLTDAEGVLDNFKFECVSFWGVDNKPEIAEYRKFSLDEIEQYIFPSQRGIIEVLRKFENKKG